MEQNESYKRDLDELLKEFERPKPGQQQQVPKKSQHPIMPRSLSGTTNRLAADHGPVEEEKK